MKRPTAATVYIVLFILFLIFLLPKVLLTHKMEVRSRNLDTELTKLRRQNLILENELRLLREDPVYLEKVAREKFNKAKQGEIVYKVVREGQEPRQRQ